MATSASVLRAQIILALQGATVAAAAGIAEATWASTSVLRVFPGDAGWIGGRNRGRCPFIEVWIEPQDFNSTNLDGGTLVSQVRVRAHAATRDARDRLDAILVAGLAAIRNTPADGYTAQGDDTIETAKPGPMGWAQDAVVSVEHTFDGTTYEAT